MVTFSRLRISARDSTASCSTLARQAAETLNHRHRSSDILFTSATVVQDIDAACRRYRLSATGIETISPAAAKRAKIGISEYHREVGSSLDP